MRIMSRISAALALGAMFSVATQAQAADAALIEAAKKEGTVVWYASAVANQLARPLAAAFEKKYPGIKVQLVLSLIHI